MNPCGKLIWLRYLTSTGHQQWKILPKIGIPETKKKQNFDENKDQPDVFTESDSDHDNVDQS